MAMVLIQVKVAPGEADFSVQKHRLRLPDEEVDQHFGLRRIDPANGIYAMKVSVDRARRIAGHLGVSGPFSSPRIEPAAKESPVMRGSGKG